MEYPKDFSKQARARVEAERLRAGRDLEKYRNQPETRPPRQHTHGPYGRLWTDDEEDIHEYILRPFLAFALEACHLGSLGWKVDRIREASATFLRKFTIDTYYEKGYDKSGHRLRKITSNFGDILPEVQREFEKSIQWHQFEDALLVVAEEQAEQEGTDRTGEPETADRAVRYARDVSVIRDVKERKDAGMRAASAQLLGGDANPWADSSGASVDLVTGATGNGTDPRALMEDVKTRERGIAHPINWSDLTITFISDERVMIELPGTRHETRNYGEMGFEDRRGGKPRAAWIDLREMSGQNGQPRYMDKKRAQEIRSLLKRLFSIDSAPLTYQKGLGYSTRFQLRRSRSFNS